MKALIDTNVILDVLCSRKSFVKFSSIVWKYCEVSRSELLRLIEVGASCFNHYCICCGVTQLNVLHNVHRRISLG